jgi:hypothetical protein
MFSTGKNEGRPKITLDVTELTTVTKAKTIVAAKAGIAFVVTIALVLATLASCSSRIGWGVVIWTVKGTTATSGTIVPIYLKSDITKTYVISLPDDARSRLEVPLWQIELFGSKGAAEKRVKQFGTLVSQYMYATRDGLPIRETASNAAKRVYRLHDGESVKVLAKTQGDPVYTGGKALPGDWYEVLAMDGTRGYVFSYALTIYDENSGTPVTVQAAQTASASDIDLVFSKAWRPSWYQTMLDDNTIDPDSFSLRYGLFLDGANKQVRVELPGFSKIFQYDSITQDKDWLVFGSSDLRIKIESPTSILANWGLPDATLLDPGKDWHLGDTQARFMVISQDIREAVRMEEGARSAAMKAFFKDIVADNGSSSLDKAGIAQFVLAGGGKLRIVPTGMYSWAGVLALPAGFAPDDQTGSDTQSGSLVFGLHLSQAMAGQWTGGFSMYPDTSGARKDYVYKLDAAGLSIAVAQTSGYGMIAESIDQRLGTLVFAFSGK